MAILIKQSGTTGIVVPANPKTGFTLAEVYALLDITTVQALPMTHQRVMLLDEEGKLKPGWHERVNEAATQLMDGRLLPGDVVVGDVLVCAPGEFQ